MGFRPLHDRVVVRRLEQEERTTGGIIIPDSAQEKPMQGEVVAVGPGSRSEEHGGGRYLFFVEFLGHQSELRARRAIQSLEKRCVRLRVLGSYARSSVLG